MSDAVEEKLDELEEITKTMDVPEFRRRKVAWLSRNMMIRNGDHPRFKEAKELITTLMKKGIR